MLIFSADGLKHLHLAFHFQLRFEDFEPGTYLVAPIRLDKINQQTIAAFVSILGHNPPQIPYGFDYKGIAFDGNSGRVLDPEVGAGHTCATFVMGVFSHLGFDFLFAESWLARTEDQTWRDRIIELLQRHGAAEAHLIALRASEVQVRFKPEEVIGSAGSDVAEWQVDFASAVTKGEEVLLDLTRYGM